MLLPRDFVWLSQEILKHTHQYISASTLRRFWGISNEGVKARRFTKDILAQYIGFANFTEFCNYNTEETVQSQFVIGEKIESKNLYCGQHLQLT